MDLVVSDLRGVLPLRLPALEALASFSARWLAPGGVMVPRRDVLWAAPCRHPASLHRRADRREGVDLAPLAAAVSETWWRQDLPASALLAPPRQWAAIDYPWRPASLAGRLTWTLAEPAPAHGLAVWFEAELAQGVGYASAPGTAGSCYGQAFFPFAEDLALAHGDELAVDLRATPAGRGFVWTWTVRQSRAGDIVTVRRHSTFYRDAPSLLPAER